MIPPFLVDRYWLVRRAFHARWPEKAAPSLPTDDPNKVVMVIDQMLAPLQNREPVRITAGEPWVSSHHTDDADHTKT